MNVYTNMKLSENMTDGTDFTSRCIVAVFITELCDIKLDSKERYDFSVYSIIPWSENVYVISEARMKQNGRLQPFGYHVMVSESEK
jgi:hypothetical protein